MIALTKYRARRVRAVLIALAVSFPLLGTSGPALADPGQSWNLDPSSGRPFDFQSYPQESGWQSNPTSPTKWAFWPVCTGTTLSDGSTYQGGRDSYCLRSVNARRGEGGPWTKLTPKLRDPDPVSLAWSSDWTAPNGSTGLGGSIGPSVRTVNKVLIIDVWDGVNDLDPGIEYQVSVHIGDYDMAVMRSVGSGGRFSQTTEASGGRVLTVSSRPGARSVLIPPTDVCTNPTARATRSHSAAWSVSLFDRKIYTKFSLFDGAVLESDAYGTGDAFPVFDTRTGTFSAKVCAPHFKADGSLNIGYYRLVLTRPMLERAGYYLTDSAGRPVTDGRLLSSAEVTRLESKVARDFRLTSSEQPGLSDEIDLVIDEAGELSVSIYADIHYSSPVLTVGRTGAAVWQTSTDASSGKYVDVGYQTGSRATGNLVVEMRTKAGKLLAKSTRKVKSVSVGRADLKVPKSAKPGSYVLKVYIAGKKANGKSSVTPLQTLPVKVTKAP